MISEGCHTVSGVILRRPSLAAAVNVAIASSSTWRMSAGGALTQDFGFDTGGFLNLAPDIKSGYDLRGSPRGVYGAPLSTTGCVRTVNGRNPWLLDLPSEAWLPMGPWWTVVIAVTAAVQARDGLFK